MNIEIVGNEVRVLGHVVAVLTDDVPSSIRAEFEDLLLTIEPEDDMPEPY